MRSHYSDPDSYFLGADQPRSRRKQEEEDDKPLLQERKPARVFKDLSEINLDSELTTQFAEATSFRDYMMENSAAFKPTEVTDSIKTCNTLIANIIKMKESVHTLERMKIFEDTVIAVMRIQKDEVKAEFFKLLEEALPK